MPRRKAVVDINSCVACGCCKKACPKDAITIEKGLYSKIDENLCVGCGRCAIACPADIITLVERENS